MTAYATPDDLLALFTSEPKGVRRTRLESLLEEATDEIIRESGGRDYFRHPTAGERTWLADGKGSSILCAHTGIVSVTTLEISQDGGETFVTVPAGEFELMGANPKSSADPPAGEPFFHVRLVPWGTYRTFPSGTATVRLTGASGWPSVPLALVEGTAERARQLAYADPSYEGNVPADDEYGRPIVTGRLPDVVFRFLRNQSRRFQGCSL